jgi:hypothetical protein
MFDGSNFGNVCHVYITCFFVIHCYEKFLSVQILPNYVFDFEKLS